MDVLGSFYGKGCLIGDGSTLQFGVGRIPDAILSSLSHLRDLSIHSGLINDAVIDLIRSSKDTISAESLTRAIRKIRTQAWWIWGGRSCLGSS